MKTWKIYTKQQKQTENTTRFDIFCMIFPFLFLKNYKTDDSANQGVCGFETGRETSRAIIEGRWDLDGKIKQRRKPENTQNMMKNMNY